MKQLHLWEREAPGDDASKLEEARVSAPAASGAGCRTLKIEEDGDFWKSRAKPKIRLIGRWLERAGFSPGGRVHVTCVAPGIIELRDLHCANEG
jgi:hypothetical protein